MSENSEEVVTRVFRALHFPNRRREVVDETDLTPKNVQPGEVLLDEESVKLYAGLSDGTVVPLNTGGVINAIVSDVTGIAGASAILNIVRLSQTAYDGLATKNPNTLYVIDNTL